MLRIYRILIALLLLIAVFSLNPVLAQSEDGAVRFVHVVPGVEAIDVYIDDTLAVAGLSSGTATTYINIPAGTINLRVTLNGLTSTLWEQPVVVPPEDKLTLVAYSTDPLNFTPYRDDPTPLSLGTGRIIVVYAIAGGSGIDFQVNGDNIVEDLQPGAFINSIDVPANLYQMQVVSSEGGDALIEETPLALNSLTTQMLVIYGTPNNAQTLLLNSATQPEGEAGFVRFAHGIGDAPPVNILLNDTLVVASLEFGGMTEHLALPTGSYSVSLQNAEDNTEVTAATLQVTADTAQTAVALIDGDEAALSVFLDAIEGIESGQALVSVINLGDSEANVLLSDGTVIAEAIAAGAASEAAAVTPFAGALEAGDQSIDVSFYGGVYYNVLVMPDGEIVIAPTSLVQAADSAPGSSDAPEVVEADETEEAGVTEEPQSTTESTPEAATLEATPAPTELPQPTAVPTTTTPTARVVLDPGANLHLREFPSPEALSLGLVPSGAVLNVNGREGAPTDRDGNVIPLEDATATEEATNGEAALEWVDPVTLLEGEDADLDPEMTWLNVTYNTPDGGSITAWVNALYLNVDDQRGLNQRLADLPTVPQNQAGEASDTSITSPVPQEEFVEAVVTQLDEGVNLNIRRTAEDNGEVLARVASGTSLRLVGLGDSGDWAYVEYAPLEGGTISGWANTEYLRYEFRDAVIEREEMDTRGLLEEVDEETLRGDMSDDASSAVSQPTRSPLRDVIVATVVPLDDGILLNLRRNPNTQAEVVAKIPAGTQLVITSRDLSSEWLETEFEGVPGWVSTQYVTLSFNQQSFALENVPLNEGLVALSSATATFTSNAPTATPNVTTTLTTTVTVTPTP